MSTGSLTTRSRPRRGFCRPKPAAACSTEIGERPNRSSPADLAQAPETRPARGSLGRDSPGQARRKAALKFERGARMWVEPNGVEQATAEPVARHKASRFAVRWSSISAQGSAAMRWRWPRGRTSLAVDLDQGMCRRIRYNAAVYNVADRVLAVRARAEHFAIPAGAWVHLDPDRRASRLAAGSMARGLPPGPGFLEVAHRGESPPGRSSSARPATSPSISPASKSRSS